MLCILEVTAWSGSTLTVSGAIEGTTDVALAVDDVLEMRPTLLAISEIQDAVHTLETTTVALPYATDAQAAFPGFRVAWWGDSLTAGSGSSGPTKTAPAAFGTLATRSTYNGGVTGDTSTQIATRMLADTARYADSAVIWAGRNNNTDPTTVKADIASMVAALGHDRYLVLAILNRNDEGTGTAAYTAITGLNSDLSAIYGTRYLDVRSYLVSLYNPGIPQDVTDHGNDVPPSSLRSDALHLNDAGYADVAADVDTKIALLDGDVLHPLHVAGLASVMLEVDALQAATVTLAGAQTITGAKTYTAAPIVKQDGFAPGWFQANGLAGMRFFGTADGTTYIQTTSDGFSATAQTPIIFGSFAGGSVVTLAGGSSASGTFTATSFVGAGSALTALNASNLTTGTAGTARIGTGTPGAGKYVDGGTGAWTALPASTGANALGTYLVQTATNAPANAQVLASLATGLLKVTTTTGVVSLAAAGTDYVTPTGSGAGLTALNASNLGSGTVPTARNGSGTASASTFLRGDSTWAAASGTGDMLANLVNTVVSVTTTTTLTSTAFAKLHVCTGTTADYTVTLPAVSGNTGKFIGFRMSGALTKLVTLDGNASETIDGATTRVMHGNETAILYCDGATWTKIAGKSIAMFCSLRAVDGGTSQNIPTATVTTINLNTANDPTGMMADAANHRIKVPRTGTYMGLGVSESSGIVTNPVNRWLTIISVNGSSDYASEGNAPVNGSPAPFLITEVRTFTAGDLLLLQTYQDSGVSQAIAGNASGAGTACYMSLMEVLQW